MPGRFPLCPPGWLRTWNGADSSLPNRVAGEAEGVSHLRPAPVSSAFAQAGARGTSRAPGHGLDPPDRTT